MTVWNQIINAVYRDEWNLVDDQLVAPVDRDNSIDVACHLAFICGEQLRKRTGEQLPEVVTWILRQPHVHRETFAEWVACDALKGDSPLHHTLLKKVEDACRFEKIQDIHQRLRECREQSKRAAVIKKSHAAFKRMRESAQTGGTLTMHKTEKQIYPEPKWCSVQ